LPQTQTAAEAQQERVLVGLVLFSALVLKTMSGCRYTAPRP
jgi:hypothetical protein